MTFGFGGALYQTIHGYSFDHDPSEGFQEGRQYGRALSTAQSVANVVAGSGLAAAGASAGPLTAAIALLGAVPSGGGTIVAGAVVITAEGAMVVIGLSEAAYGLALLAYSTGNPLPGSSHLRAGDKTPGGRTLTQHGAQRANERGFTGERIDDIIDNPSQRVYQQGGRTVYAQKIGGRYYVVITDRAGAVITVVGGKGGTLRRWPDVTKMLNNQGGYTSVPVD
jgi:hypothetical protein